MAHRPVFTAHERALARAAWTSSQARLTRDSFLPFGSCSLCLEPAKDPVSCEHGDVFCRECCLANLVAQKKEIKRLHKAQVSAEKDMEQARAEMGAEAQRRFVKEFESVQAGAAITSSSAMTPNEGLIATLATLATHETLTKHAGAKRKFDLDRDEVDRISRQDVTRTAEAMAAEKAKKPKLPSFWTPSLTPSLDAEVVLAGRKKFKAAPVCPASPQGEPHALSQKHLISLQFTEDLPDGSRRERVCPSCMKTLSNASRPMLAKPCGHVICRPCVGRLVNSPTNMLPSEEARCYVCDASLGSDNRDDEATVGKKAKKSFPVGLVELKTDGTGFSATGASVVERVTTNFQC